MLIDQDINKHLILFSDYMHLIFVPSHSDKRARMYRSIFSKLSTSFVMISLHELIHCYSIEIKVGEQQEQPSYFILKCENAIIDSREVKSFINCISFISTQSFNHIVAADVDYVCTEWNAIFLVLLKLLDSVNLFNKAYPFEYVQKILSEEEKEVISSKAHLVYKRNTTTPIEARSYFVYQNNIFGNGPLKDSTREKLFLLQKHCDCTYLMATILTNQSYTYLYQINTKPDIDLFPKELLYALFQPTVNFQN